ncbi:hypothetical protein BT69DRAFT_1356010 [Atractiella rhizophila]|nr:hypothetical protein BT69DRAFT_1356010 [Atractiella rhizophila]
MTVRDKTSKKPLAMASKDQGEENKVSPESALEGPRRQGIAEALQLPSTITETYVVSSESPYKRQKRHERFYDHLTEGSWTKEAWKFYSDKATVKPTLLGTIGGNSISKFFVSGSEWNKDHCAMLRAVPHFRVKMTAHPFANLEKPDGQFVKRRDESFYAYLGHIAGMFSKGKFVPINPNNRNTPYAISVLSDALKEATCPTVPERITPLSPEVSLLHMDALAGLPSCAKGSPPEEEEPDEDEGEAETEVAGTPDYRLQVWIEHGKRVLKVVPCSKEAPLKPHPLHQSDTQEHLFEDVCHAFVQLALFALGFVPGAENTLRPKRAPDWWISGWTRNVSFFCDKIHHTYHWVMGPPTDLVSKDDHNKEVHKKLRWTCVDDGGLILAKNVAPNDNNGRQKMEWLVLMPFEVKKKGVKPMTVYPQHLAELLAVALRRYAPSEQLRLLDKENFKDEMVYLLALHGTKMHFVNATFTGDYLYKVVNDIDIGNLHVDVYHSEEFDLLKHDECLTGFNHLCKVICHLADPEAVVSSKVLRHYGPYAYHVNEKCLGDIFKIIPRFTTPTIPASHSQGSQLPLAQTKMYSSPPAGKQRQPMSSVINSKSHSAKGRKKGNL